ncbi:MAG TPA: hypothetical protein VMH80_23760 [Bryobacteraceae bacterium]|nr:hypothetical protein [Bryobacteraceae bacterium]
MRTSRYYCLRVLALGVSLPLLAPGQPPPQRRARVAPPALILKFTVKPETVHPGQQAVLTWATENPIGVTIDPDVGPVTARGIKQVFPTATTTYTLKVGGPNDAVLTKSVTVTVMGAASTAPKAAAASADARMPDGKPDLTGVYGFAGVRGLAPPDLKPGAEKFKVDRSGNFVGGRTTLGTDCVPLGVPQTFVTPYPFQIVQKQNFLVMLFEYPNTFRFIPLDGRPHTPDPDPTWMGESVGHWDGDTLVVDTIGFNDKTEVSGYMHTEALHVVERYRRVDKGLLYDVTVEDPNVFQHPWVFPERLLPAHPEEERVDEFVCENHVDYSKYFGKDGKE